MYKYGIIIAITLSKHAKLLVISIILYLFFVELIFNESFL